MTLVAHQRYAELVDESVYLETLQFNAKAHYAILPPFRGSVYLTPLSNEKRSELICADVSVSGVGNRIPLVLSDCEPVLPHRLASASTFTNHPGADFHALKCSASNALMAQPDESGLARMPYRLRRSALFGADLRVPHVGRIERLALGRHGLSVATVYPGLRVHQCQRRP